MRRTTIAAIPVLVLAAALVAGPLDPPAGPVTSTYKTLTEVEPRIAINATNTPGDADSLYRISQPGSYYLTGNIAGVASKRCIEVASDNVTIDLNGMTIVGDAASIGGIIASNAQSNLTVRNGTIRSIGAGSGLDTPVSGGRGWRVENVSAINNVGAGLNVPGSSIVRACRAYSNSGSGIAATENSQVIDCVCEQNGAAGVSVNNGAIVSSTICRTNVGDGINAASDGVRVMNCTVYGNTGNGIVGLNGAHITGCIVRNNTLAGITANASCLIQDNDVTFSGGHGIAVLNNCVIRDNICDQNGQSTLGAGIYANNGRNRIEGNSCASNDYGIRAPVSGNFIARNVVSSNTTLNWDIGIGNRCLVVASVGGAAISGNSGGVSPGSTDPNANFTN